MAVISGSVSALLDNKWPETINRNLTEYLPNVDPMFAVNSTSQGVSRSEWGKDYKIKKVIQGTFSGATRMEGTSSNIISGDAITNNLRNLYTQNEPISPWPSPLLGANAKASTMTIEMKAMLAEVEWTLEELRLDANPQVIGAIVEPKTRGFISHIAHMRCFQFYTSNVASTLTIGDITTGYSLGAVTEVEYGTNGTADENLLRVKVDTTDTSAPGRPIYFYRGMRVDLWCNDGGTAKLLNSLDGTNATRVECYVMASAAFDGVITLQLSNDSAGSTRAWKGGSGSDTINLDISASTNGKAYIFWAESANQGYNGLESFLVGDSGSILGVPTMQYPELQSFVYAANQTLTDTLFRQVISAFNDARSRFGIATPNFITSPGVLNAWASTKAPLMGFNNMNGATLNLNGVGLNDSYSFVHEGRTHTISASRWVAPGRMYGTDLRGWTRYVAPATPGLGKMDGMPEYMELEFVAPYANGTGSIKFPVSKVFDGITSMTNMVYCPADSRMELIPDQFSGIKITGLTEESLVLDNTANLLL